MSDWTEMQKSLLQLGLTIFVGLTILLAFINRLDTYGSKFRLSKLALSPLRFVVKWVPVQADIDRQSALAS